jgi:hypothetical protein
MHILQEMERQRAKIALGNTLVIAVLVVMARDFHFIEIAIVLVGLFFIVWGRDSHGTEAFIGRLRGGKYVLKFLDQIDLILSPRDREYDQHIRGVILGYDNNLQKALRRLLKTRNPMDLTGQEWEQIHRDRLVDSPSNNRGPVKAELRYIVNRVLDELGI